MVRIFGCVTRLKVPSAPVSTVGEDDLRRLAVGLMDDLHLLAGLPAVDLAAESVTAPRTITWGS